MSSRSIAGALLGTTMVFGSAPALSAAPAQEGGTIYVQLSAAPASDDPALRVFVAATSTALGAKGFTILTDPGHAAYVAEVTVKRETVGTARSKVRAGRPAMAGTGVSIPFSTGQFTLVPLVRTRMEVRIRMRNASTILWRGAAVTIRSTGSRDGSDEQVASALSGAALGAYPVQTAEVIGVP